MFLSDSFFFHVGHLRLRRQLFLPGVGCTADVDTQLIWQVCFSSRCHRVRTESVGDTCGFQRRIQNLLEEQYKFSLIHSNDWQQAQTSIKYSSPRTGLLLSCNKYACLPTIKTTSSKISRFRGSVWACKGRKYGNTKDDSISQIDYKYCRAFSFHIFFV